MNKLARSVLALYSYDENPDSTALENVMRQSIQLIARLPLYYDLLLSSQKTSL